MTVCVIKRAGARIQVYAPFSNEFKEKANMLAGKWRPRSNMWSFRLNQYKYVRAACVECYSHVTGYGGESAEV